MVVRYGYVIYKSKLHLGPLAIKVEKVYTTSNISYNRKIGREKLHQFLKSITMLISSDIRSRSWTLIGFCPISR